MVAYQERSFWYKRLLWRERVECSGMEMGVCAGGESGPCRPREKIESTAGVAFGEENMYQKAVPAAKVDKASRWATPGGPSWVDLAFCGRRGLQKRRGRYAERRIICPPEKHEKRGDRNILRRRRQPAVQRDRREMRTRSFFFTSNTCFNGLVLNGHDAV